MTWRLIDRPKTQKVTKALAKTYAEMEPAPHDRPLSERRLAVYEKLLTAGEFRPVTWASAICKETGGVYRVNGKHTSVLLSGLDKVPEFYVTVEEYECDDLSDVAQLYATFDSKMQSRTSRDINMSFAATVPVLKDLPAYCINLAVGGMSYWQWKEGQVNAQLAERAEQLLEHPEFVVWLAGVFSSGETGGKPTRSHSRHLQRVAVVAAMFATWQKAQKQSTQFWEAVRDETGASPTVPDRKLARYLLTVGINTGQGSQRARQAKPREFYVKCLHGWNAWRKGETTNLNYYPDAKLPVPV